MSAVEVPDLFSRICDRLGGIDTARRTIFVSQRFNYVYVANQKSACSTIKLALYRAELDDPDYLPANIHKRDGNPIARPTDVPAHRLEAMLAGAAFRFTFVRNPYTRLLSAYLDKVKATATEQPNRYREAAGRRYWGLLRRHFGIETQAALDGFGFTDFVSSVCAQEFGDMDIHWRPQVVNICHGLVAYDFIGRSESFESDMRGVAARLGFAYAPAPRINHTGADDRIGSYYTPAAAEMVLRKFHVDFDAFGYPRHLPA